MTLLLNHPQRKELRERLQRNIVLRRLKKRAFEEIASHLAIVDYRKGDVLLSQGAHDMEQYFVLDGILKRVVASPEGKEMILRFASEDDMDTSYAAWKLRTPAPYSIRAVTKAQVAKLPLPQWAAFLDRHPDLRDDRCGRGTPQDALHHPVAEAPALPDPDGRATHRLRAFRLFPSRGIRPHPDRAHRARLRSGAARLGLRGRASADLRFPPHPG